MRETINQFSFKQITRSKPPKMSRAAQTPKMPKIVPIALLLLLRALPTQSAVIPLPSDYRIGMNYHYNQDQKIGYFVADTVITLDPYTLKTQNVGLTPDFAYQKTIVAEENSEIGGQVDCDGESRDLCYFVGATTSTNYDSMTLVYRPIQTVYPLVPGTNVRDYTSNFNALMASQLQSSSLKWPYPGSGVLGLSKNSEFLDYVRSQYSVDIPNQITLSLLVRVNQVYSQYRFEGEHDFVFSGSVLGINGIQTQYVVDGEDYSVEWLSSSDPLFWAIDDLSIDLGNSGQKADASGGAAGLGLSIGSGKACLALQAPEMVLIPGTQDDLTALKIRVMNLICKKNSCDSSLQVVQSAPALVIRFDTTTDTKNSSFSIDGTRFLYNKNGTLEVSFGLLQPWIDAGKCPKDSQIGLGRLFFAEKYVLMKTNFEKDGSKNTAIGFVGVVNVNDLKGLDTVFIIILSILGFMVVTFLIRVVVLWKRDKEDDRRAALRDALEAEAANAENSEIDNK